jgi:hypothetical protein
MAIGFLSVVGQTPKHDHQYATTHSHQFDNALLRRFKKDNAPTADHYSWKAACNQLLNLDSTP